MNRFLYVMGAMLLIATTTYAAATDLEDISTSEADPRFFFVTSANTTSITISYASLVYGLFTLLALGLLAALLAYYLFDTEESTGYGSTGYGSSYSSYGGGHSGRAFESADPNAIAWGKLNILDWIALLEETYRNLDVANENCHKKIVCELSQNQNQWGPTARKLNDAFSYLQYLELLNLPADIHMLLGEYLEAANKGRTMQKSCSDIYTDCAYSLKETFEKYGGSNSV